MNPRWKSVWILPAAAGAFVPRSIVQARDSLGPAVKNVISPSRSRPDQAIQSRLLEPEFLQECGLVLGRQFGDLRLEFG